MKEDNTEGLPLGNKITNPLDQHFLPDPHLPLWAIVAAILPLGIFLPNILWERKKGFPADKLAFAAVFISLLISLYAFFQVWMLGEGKAEIGSSFEWFKIGAKPFIVNIQIDGISSIMLVVVTLVSTLVHLFSMEYMKDDENYNRYFAYLGLFTFSMLGLVLTSNLAIIYIFWELVGLSSYLLIGFWQHKSTARRAAKKAFLLNRIGDAGFLIGLLALYATFNSLELSEIFPLVEAGQLPEGTMATIAGLGLFCGAVGKSAQFPLSVWLPDAMEGPTPVSALIHAATMVAAGVYLLARVMIFFTPEVFVVISIIGAITAFLAAVSALSQTDIKKVLAYSTISQLGYMVAGIGSGAMDAAMFHLLTHAFFKAGLFLSAGAVIHALHVAAHDLHTHFDAQDMRLMGGLRKKMPTTFLAFSIAGLGLAGLPLFSGFLSKDAIITASFDMAASGSPLLFIAPILLLVSALMTAFYVGRQLLLVFFGENRLKNEFEKASEAIKEVPLKMLFPIGLLAFLTIGFVFSLNPLNAHSSWFMHPFDVGHHSPFQLLTGIVSFALASTGLFIAWLVYGNGKLLALKNSLFPEDNFWRKLSFNFWYLDKIFEIHLKNVVLWISRKTAKFDRRVIDKSVNDLAILHVVTAHVSAWFDRFFVDGLVNGIVFMTGKVGKYTSSIQGGKIQSYLAWTLFGLIFLLIYFII
ncbi:NADH-quinone oxidoreductase subunit L [Flammeovirgaceae bacterium SG7u.111]|nr:NADH-quinone oxidoreductase subunit L [Flammeovirgaceae bacterium SG7u.132]WPO38376.1 NADH-quinone oxidoreductase subunit L [Flammeovirgaceae bacterium SG7u.111]